MRDHTPVGRVSSGRCLARSGCRRGQLDDFLGWGEVEFGQDVTLRFGQLSALAVGAGRAGEGADVQGVEFVAQVVPDVAGGGLDDAHQQ